MAKPAASLVKLFGEEAKQLLTDELRCFKTIEKAGEIVTTEGKPKGQG